MIPSRHRLGYSQAHGFKDNYNKCDPLGPHVDDISAIGFSEDGKLLLSSSTDSTSKLWKTQSGKPAVLCRTLEHPEAVSCISCSPIEHGWRTCKIATVSGDGKLRIWDFSLDASLGGPTGGTNPTDPPIKEIACHDDVVWSCAFNPLDEKKVSTASSDCTVKTWDVSTGECIATYVGHLSWVTSVAYNYGATLLCSASKDTSVRLWDATRPGRQVMELWGHDSWVTAACFTPNSASLFSASHDKTVRQWDLSNGVEVARLHGHAGPVQALDVSSDGLMMATTSWDGTCRLWSLRMRKLLCVLPLSDAPPKQGGAIGLAATKGLAVSISPHGHVAVGGSAGTIKDFFAPPAVNKSLTDTRDYAAAGQAAPSGAEWAAKLAGKKEVAPIGWVVDMILNLHHEDTQIKEYMEENCSKFKMDYRVGKATQEQHDMHAGYVDRVLNFMEEACDGLNIDPDDFVRALTVLARREEPEAQDLVLQMDAVEDFPLFFSLMSLKRIENHVGEGSDYESEDTSDYESEYDSDDDNENGGGKLADLPPLRKSKNDPRRMRPGTTGQLPSVSASHSKRAVQDLLATSYLRSSLQTRAAGVDLAMRLSQRDIRTSWERQATTNPKEDGHWEEVAQIKKEKEEVEARARVQEQYIRDLEKRVADSEKKRAALHNKVQELRGNIRVFCRVRPPLPNEEGEQAEIAFDSTGDRPAIDVSFLGAGNRKQKLKFDFDEVFRLDTSQRQVYKEVEPLLQSVMDGYKVCIFAYGQTGSGKTFTMEGKMDTSSDEDDARGVVPRCMQRLLAIRDEMKETGDWTISMTATAVEIYNENIRDLLSDESSKRHEVLTEKDTGETYVSDAVVVPVATEEEIYKVVRGASQRRETKSTARNATSSRSHQVLQIRVYSKNNKTGENLLGIMNMVDLAGSERVGETHDETRLKEAQNINKSLSCLLGVITAIATKQSHVPFRNTKLTHLLQSSLSGHGKAIMFANVSPLLQHVNESVNTFRFATQVSSVQLGTGKHTAHAKKPPAKNPDAPAPQAAPAPAASKPAAPAAALTSTGRPAPRGPKGK